MMKTVVLEEMPPLFWEIIKKNGYSDYFLMDNDENAQVVIIRTKTVANKAFLDAYPNLKLIIRAGTGFDNIDIAYAFSKGIAVQNTPEANAQSAYEHTIAMISSLIKQLPKAKNNVLNGNWKKNLKYNYEFSDITALVVGVGRIGKRVAKALQFFGAKVLGVDPYLSQDEREILGIGFVSYEKGLQLANLITYHCPLTKHTKDYFSVETLEILSNPIFLINVARGRIVDENAIIEGFKRNLLLGVAMDVFENEPWENKDFANRDNVILSPHIGAYTQKAKDRMAKETIKVWENFVFDNRLTYEIITYE